MNDGQELLQVENGNFLGIYIARQGVPGPSLPVPNASGLWQVWEQDDESVLVQPLGSNKEPWGKPSRIAMETFQCVLAPIPTDREIASVSKRFLQADSPDLIDIWYENSLSFSRNSPGAEDVITTASAPVAEGKANAAPDGSEDLLAGFSPAVSDDLAAWAMPFDIMAEESPAPATAQAEKTAAELVPQEAPKKPVQEKQPVPDASDVEKELRSKFAFIFERLENPPSPEISEAMLRVLGAREGVTSEHRYMFSEFGMELRRKKLTDLALAAHRRALELAPEDGYVLFNLARSEYESGDIQTAREHLKKTLKVLPDFAPAVNFLKFLGGD